MVNIRLRENQRDILKFPGGKMGISAVPGSGKTFTLSLLAAEVISSGRLRDDQEVLVVTLVNSAVENFELQINKHLVNKGLIPDYGFRVRTLHGLAHDIVRERPELAGLSEEFQIIDERETRRILREVVRAWLKSHSGFFDQLFSSEVSESQIQSLFNRELPKLLEEVMVAFIRTAKDQRISPERLASLQDEYPIHLPFTEMGSQIYFQYQNALRYRGGLDFDDLIRHAIHALEIDNTLLERLRNKWPYIFEDEAQDSSRLQEQILELLTGEAGNWVRVGDMNQAIYETFTTANPEFLEKFIERDGVIKQELPESGRFTVSIIALANHLVEWTKYAHPNPEARNAFHIPPLIKPSRDDDPHPNPMDFPPGIRLIDHKFTPESECNWVAKSVAKWLNENPDRTVAALVPRNARGNDLVAALQKVKVDHVDLLRSSFTTRSIAGDVEKILRFLANPDRRNYLLDIYRLWRTYVPDKEISTEDGKRIVQLLKGIQFVENFIWPLTDIDWFEQIGESDEAPQVVAELLDFRNVIRDWQKAASLPIDQLILAIAQGLFIQPDQLALAHKFASLLKQTSYLHPDWNLTDYAYELQVIASNQQRFLGFSEGDMGFDPEKYRGKVLVTTLHKAKGLEWDKVYLLSINNYDFPSGDDYDEYYEEKWYFRTGFNFQAETLAQLKALLSADEFHSYVSGAASADARNEYIRERLRLFYVGITRARRELVITWNSGRNGNLRPAKPLLELISFWENRMAE